MKQFLCALLLNSALISLAQTDTRPVAFDFKEQKILPVTVVKNQGLTGTCWSFSTTSLLESQCIKDSSDNLDLGELFTVRNIYIEKAKNYVLRLGGARFDEGGLGHDMIRAVTNYGAVPESVYSGLKQGQQQHNHTKLKTALKAYLDSILKNIPLDAAWLDGFVKILDETLGAVPASFDYQGKNYTPLSFAKEVLNFNANDYINITSFTHQPYYQPFILQVPDNFSNGQYYNLPLNEMIQLVKEAVGNGYSVMWDADVSNSGFLQKKGIALLLSDLARYDMKKLQPDTQEPNWDANIRQQLYENLTTQDDHLMHIYGIEKSAGGKTFFVVKNSWGNIGPYQGSIHVSEAYFAINTISLVVPKAALSKAMLQQLQAR